MELFDSRIPVLKSEEYSEYNELLSRFPDFDKSYIFNAAYSDRRQYIQSAYQKCKDYLDEDFSLEIKQKGKFISRMWELQLCSVLLFFKLNLQKPPRHRSMKSRPDFCILDTNGNRIWIEAICPDLGDVPEKEEMIPGILYTRNSNIKDELELVSPRITSAIQKKHKMRESYVNSKDFDLNDRYVIAINTHHISHRETGEMPKELVLFGMGLQWIKQDGKSGRYFHWTIPKRKNNGTSIELDVALFFRPEFRDLSAVMTCSNWFKFGESFENEMSKDFVTYYNHEARNKIYPNELDFGTKKGMICEGEKCQLINI